MKIAIVGSSHLSETEMFDARKFCGLILNQAIRDCAPDMLGGEPILVSGGAKGVDSIAEDVAKELKIKTIIHKPLTHYFETGYKPRNIKIAQDCDVLYCFPTALKTTPCYHCKVLDHEVSGGCWTLRYAKSLGRKTHLVPLI